MKASLVSLLVIIAAAGLGVSSSMADDSLQSLRCDSKLVQVGDNKMEVLSKCGEPDLRDNAMRNVYLGGGAYGVQYEEQWTYNFGPNDFLYTLSFDGSRLRAIARGGRGSTK